ncbi:MAG TPA: hypothetical protein VLF87_02160 [Patescibacteria group bacterium]|nr:hypothetical protein [Patescibacteria group bacterium]
MTYIEPNTPVVAEGLPVTFRDQTVWRAPGEFDQSYMIEIDFDETCFTTFISSGTGIEVHQAYEMAVETVLGSDARQDFSDYQGLSNRAPLDVIQGLIMKEPGLIGVALQHAREHYARPEDITDIGLGLIARFANRASVDNDELTLRAITEMLVIRKKDILFPQISDEWPMPVKGFQETWQELYDRRQADERFRRLHTAIVSSGHTDFIKTIIERAGLPNPDVYMTDDEMRRQVHPRTKPDPYALELVRNAWLNAYLVRPELRQSPEFMAEAKGRQVYIGDDEEKDGEMAANDGIRFLQHHGGPDDWKDIGELIIARIESGEGFGG